MGLELSEKELEKIMMLSVDTLEEKGFLALYSNRHNQIKISDDSIVDILAYDSMGDDGIFKCQIVELKKGPIDIHALAQIMRYYKEILISVLKYPLEKSIELILVGSDISDDLYFLPATGCRIRFFRYFVSSTGLHFEEHNLLFQPEQTKPSE